MTKQEIKKLYRKAIEKYGNEAQYIIAIEEMSELTKELTKQIRWKESDNLCEEIIDVEIMIEQLKAVFPDNYKKIFEEIKTKKLQRLKERLNK